jgi:hypothetical protein
MYATDYDGTVSVGQQRSNAGTQDGMWYWRWYDYVTNTQVYVCGSGQQEQTVRFPTGEEGPISYATICERCVRGGICNISAMKRPANTILLSDNPWSPSRTCPQSHQSVANHHPLVTMDQDYELFPWHDTTVSICFMDGHAKSLQYTTLAGGPSDPMFVFQ